ncbi:MAG TPA: hypothetical protein PLF87_09890 [Syntrophorhabdaceae bacterium]|jgi:hypothetical protein|nr:hypothetical protein [Syntrophorhabdaceae bacterium]
MEQARGGDMSTAIIDAREWQNTFDLRTGAKVETDNPVVKFMRDVLCRHPYPGDTDPGSNAWVSNTALDLIAQYKPQLVFLAYAGQFFQSRYTQMNADERTEMYASVFTEVNRFIAESGFTPIILGTGGVTPFVDYIDVSRLDGLAITTHWSARYAGLHNAGSKDLKSLAKNPKIEKVLKREDLLNLFCASSDEAARVPDHILLAKEGFSFKTSSGTMRKALMLPARNFHIPVSCPMGNPGNITDICNIIEETTKRHKTAVIILEGIGTNEFPKPYTRCLNGLDWYYYEPGEAQYLAVTTGEHRVFDYPVGYKYFEEEEETKQYPLSGYFTSIPKGMFADRFPGRSIAVGNKSMFMHMVTGADLSVECFARNLYNQGTMGVIHRHDKI